MADEIRTAGVRVRPDTRRWQTEVEDRVRVHGFDAVVESALADVEELRTSAAAYRHSGHRIEAVALAMPEAWSPRKDAGAVGAEDEDLAERAVVLSPPAQHGHARAPVFRRHRWPTALSSRHAGPVDRGYERLDRPRTSDLR